MALVDVDGIPFLGGMSTREDWEKVQDSRDAAARAPETRKINKTNFRVHDLGNAIFSMEQPHEVCYVIMLLLLLLRCRAWPPNQDVYKQCESRCGALGCRRCSQLHRAVLLRGLCYFVLSMLRTLVLCIPNSKMHNCLLKIVQVVGCLQERTTESDNKLHEILGISKNISLKTSRRVREIFWADFAPLVAPSALGERCCNPNTRPTLLRSVESARQLMRDCKFDIKCCR